MDAFDYADARETPAPSTSALIWNILTVAILIMVLCVAAVFLLFFINPNNSMNPFPPPTQIQAVPTFTPTPTPRIQLVATWTNTPTELPTATQVRPTNTPLVTETPVPSEPTATMTEMITATPPEYSFVVQDGSPTAISGTGFHPEAGCSWMGVAGQATSLNGSPVIGLFVLLGGELNGKLYEEKLSMTCTAPQYGQGGFEFTIADQTIASNDTLWIQLLDQANLPISEKVNFDTFAECEKNLIIIYFTQVK